MIPILVVAALAIGGLLGALLRRCRPTGAGAVRRAVDDPTPGVHAGWSNLNGS